MLVMSPPLLMVPFVIDMRAPGLRTPYAERRMHEERCRGRKELVPEMRFEKVDR